jgi:hypothetical protein
MRDALGLTSDQLYQWRLLLEEYRPKIIYIKGIHKSVADTVSWLEYDPSVNQTVDLIGPYTLNGKDGSSIDFMCLTRIDPTKSWFEIVKLPTVAQETTVPPTGKGKR